MTTASWVALGVLVLMAVVRVRVEHCVRRRASDPPELQDGQKHWGILVWCPLIHYRGAPR